LKKVFYWDGFVLIGYNYEKNRDLFYFPQESAVAIEDEDNFDKSYNLRRDTEEHRRICCKVMY